jgi:hypothetical protein
MDIIALNASSHLSLYEAKGDSRDAGDEKRVR